MTNGELFIKENPTVETKLNGSCVWIYFDGVNHYTMPTLWWNQEISLFDKIELEIKAMFPPSGSWMYEEGHEVEHTVCEVLVNVLQIIDKYRNEVRE